MMAMAARARISTDANQSCSLPRSSISCKAPTKITSRINPTTSMGALILTDSKRAKVRAISGAQPSAIGTLMKKMKGQERLSQIHPPRIGPSTGATRVVMAHSAMAAGARSLGKIRVSKVCDKGIRQPPASPCMMRPNTSMLSDPEKPHKAEKIPNNIMAVVNTRTAPNRAASQPVSGTTIASATE
jgi:hypothetical protein